jgi:molybdate transport system ATP-binding protein
MLRLSALALVTPDFTLTVDLELARPVTALFGPSGAGKTTLVELVAGLRRPTAGMIELDGRRLDDAAAGSHLPPRLRAVGYVPQDGALFPHLSVRRNLLYGARSESPHDDALGFERVLAVLALAPLLDREIGTLSGGEKRRVAIGRALFAGPRLLLLDEPMAGLDHDLRRRLLDHLLQVRSELRVPMVYVSHEPDEIASLCDEVVHLEAGRVRGQATVADWAAAR